MASWSQTFSGNSNYTLTLSVTETSTSTANNTSTLSYSLTATKSAGSGYWSTNKYPVKVTLNGIDVVNITSAYDFTSTTPQTITLGSGSGFIVKHLEDGSKSISVSASYTTSSSIGSASISQTMPLTTLPRASTFTMNTYSLTPSSGNLVMALQRASSSFWHQTIVSVNGVQKESWNAQQYANVTWTNAQYTAFVASSGITTMTFTLVTYSDSAHTNEVGRYSANVMYSALTNVPLKMWKRGGHISVAIGGSALFSDRVTFGLTTASQWGVPFIEPVFELQGSSTSQSINLATYGGSGYLLLFRGNHWGNYYNLWYVSTRTASNTMWLIASGGGNHATVSLSEKTLSIACDSYGGTFICYKMC